MAHKGIILKQSREAKGLSLETVHEATKIPMDALRAIEEGYTVRTLTSFYYKGFIKMYAQYLGVDPSEILSEAKVKEDKPSKVLHQDIKREIRNVPQFGYSVQPNPLDNLKGFLTPDRRRQILAIFGLIVGLFILFKTVSFVNGWFRSKAAKKRIEQRRERMVNRDEVQQSRPEANRAGPVVQTVASQPAARGENKPTITAPAATTDVTLTVRAKKDCWLQVKSDGSVVFQSTLSKGDVETWKAEEMLELSGKNIGELEFELNGNMIGALGRAERGARKLYVTRDGLTVKM